MTKRVSVKTTLATKRAFLGPRSQAGALFLIRKPLFLPARLFTF